MTGDWRLLRDGAASAAWNMSLDEALLQTVEPGQGVLRLYSWDKPALSLGHRLPAANWLERTRWLNLDCVRRVTGGGAVLHGADLSYAVVAGRGCPSLPGGVRGSYDWIQRAISAALLSLGLNVERPAGDAGADRKLLCFEGATSRELVLGARKLVGSAQRRTRWAVLQHGSIRLAPQDQLHRALFGQEIAAPAWPPGINAEDLEDACVQSFAEALDGRLKHVTCSDKERSVASEGLRLRTADALCRPALSSRTASD